MSPLLMEGDIGDNLLGKKLLGECFPTTPNNFSLRKQPHIEINFWGGGAMNSFPLLEVILLRPPVKTSPPETNLIS